MGLLDAFNAQPGSAEALQLQGLLGGLTRMGGLLAQAGQFRPAGTPGPGIGDAFLGFGEGQKQAIQSGMQTRRLQRSISQEDAWRDAASGAPTTPDGQRLYSSIPERHRTSIFAMGPEQGLKALSGIITQRPVAVSPGQTLVGNDGPGTRVPYTEQDFAFRAAGAPRTTVSVDQRAESEFEKAYGKKQAETAIGVLESGASAQGTIDTVSRMRDLLPKVQPGALTPALTTITGFAQSVGMSPDTLRKFGLPESAAPGEMFSQLANKMTMGMIGGPGGIPSNNFSNTDLQFARNTVPQLFQRPETISAGLDALEKIAKRDQERTRSWNAARGKKVSFDDWQSQWAEHVNKNPLFPGGTPGTAVPPLSVVRPDPRRALDGAQPPSQPPRVTTQQQYLMLPRGAPYIDPEGNPRVKQ